MTDYKVKWESLWEIYSETFARLQFYMVRCGLWKRTAKIWRTYALDNETGMLERERLWREAEATATRRLGLVERANMALLVYTQSHGTPHTQLMDEIAEALGLDADGNTLPPAAEVGDET